MKTPIMSMLGQKANHAKTRFCMPGHKGKFGPDALRYDITELEGADNLYLPVGVIKESQNLHSEFIGAKESFFLVNGSSCGVHAAVLSVLEENDKVLVARDFHMSAVHAFALANVKPVFLYPAVTESDLPGVITPRQVQKALQEHPDAKALYLTYPNYYGLCADINEICRLTHDAGMVLICDSAHAAAFDFSELLPLAPAEAGCDIWVTSLHKTLAALNQCATLNLGAHTVLQKRTVQSRLNMLQTTSPSYLLLGSADVALAYMREHGNEALAAIVHLVEDAICRIEALGGYRCVTQDVPREIGAYDRDILRLVIDVTDRGLSGLGAANILEAEGICVEAADLSHIILICTIADEWEDFERLFTVLNGIKGSNYQIRHPFSAAQKQEAFLGKFLMGLREAAFAKTRAIPLKQSRGNIAATCAGAYPPGVPVIVTGQEITEAKIEYLCTLKENGYTLFGCDSTIEIADL